MNRETRHAIEESARELETLLSQQSEIEATVKTLRDRIIALMKTTGENRLIYMTSQGPRVVGYNQVNPSDKLNTAKLEKFLDHDMWLAATVPARRVDESKLAKLIEQGKLKVSHLKKQGIIEVKEASEQRVGPRELTPKELEEANLNPATLPSVVAR